MYNIDCMELDKILNNENNRCRCKTKYDIDVKYNIHIVLPAPMALWPSSANELVGTGFAYWYGLPRRAGF